MSDSKRNSGALENPLDDVLGAPANLRILRVLARRDSPLGRADAARRARLTPQGGRKAIGRLFHVGVVEYVGSGHTQQVCLRREHPLAPALVSLFKAEATRYEELLRALETRVKELGRHQRAVWIEGRAAEGVDEYGDPLVLGLLAGADKVDSLAERLRDLLVEVEREHDVTIEVRGYTEADVVTRLSEDGKRIPLSGPDPSALLREEGGGEGPRMRRHEQHDARALRRSWRLADLLVREPGLRDRALEWLSVRLQQEGDNRDLQEWRRILESASLPRLRRLLTAESERAARLRQSLPFWPILTDEERAEILAESRDESRST